jgi:DNA invertase Pin-like site-specific DNA recombinase
MAALAQKEGLLVTDTRRESHSAKTSGQRPVFNKLLADIKIGEFSGILTWAPDRLSRNAGDLGSLVDLMDSKYLTQIKTHGQTFTSSPNDKFMLMILCSQAKLENDNRGINVKRGQRAKCEMGFRPNFAPLGYTNDYYSGKGQKRVFLDKKRAPIIKEMFEKVAYKKYSGRDVYDWLKNETDFRSRNGNIITLSMIYRMLNNPYYCGLFEYADKWYKGSYQPIITRELFDLVQKKMTIPRKVKPGTKVFDYTRIFKCASCGSGITAQEKFRRYKNGKVQKYIYYHCTKFNNRHCDEQYIREEDITNQLIELLKDVSIEIINVKRSLKSELDKFLLIHNTLDQNNTDLQVCIRGFVNYVFTKGTREQKRELIECLEKEIQIRGKQLF